jgi:hypothetical protein
MMPTKLQARLDRQSIKLCVTVKRRLKCKYDPAALEQIKAALKRWIKADAERGIRTIYIAVDDHAAMKKRGVQPVSGKVTAPKIKRAIDDLWKRLAPEYLVLFGAHDVVPMFEVSNPDYDPGGDTDKTLLTDSPYASSFPFLSGKRRSYMVPDRVIGRIPDMVSEPNKCHKVDPMWLLSYLKTATFWTSNPANLYTETYAICAEQWQSAGEQCMQYITRPTRELLISPPKSDTSSPARKRLSARLHMIKCHGSPGQATFYGYPQQPDSALSKEREDALFKPAITSATLRPRLKPATVVATACCYSAQIFFDPHTWPLASTYLRKGAFGFLGSTKQTSNNVFNMDWADRIVTDYLKMVLGGASIGRAFLDAKQLYLSRLIFGRHPYGLDHGDEKTLIEYVLLGDPSIHPVTTESESAAVFAAEDRRLRRLSRQLASWQVRKMLPTRQHATPEAQAMAKKVFTRAGSMLTKDLIKELKAYGIKPNTARVEKLVTRIHAPREARVGPAFTRSRQSLQYYWSGRRNHDGHEQIRVLKAETDLKGNVWRASVSYNS